jgi:hypothetical protein
MKREDGRREVIYFKMYNVDKKPIFSDWWVPTERTMYGWASVPGQEEGLSWRKKKKMRASAPRTTSSPNS